MKEPNTWRVFFLVLLAMLVMEVVTGCLHLENSNLIEPIVIILLWLAGQR